MLSAGMDKVYRDTILGHTLHGMDVHYMSPSEEDLHRAMGGYTAWLDGQIANVSATVSKDGRKVITKLGYALDSRNHYM